ncbi:phosphate ABC transporter permease PstA [Thermopirellula anaerolimosa]
MSMVTVERELPAVQTSQTRRRSSRPANLIAARGEPLVWLSGGGLVVSLVMIGGLLVLIAYHAILTFWPTAVIRVELRDGSVAMGEVTRRERFKPEETTLNDLPEEVRDAYRDAMRSGEGWVPRRLVRTGNFELTNEHFRWVASPEIVPGSETRPEWALVLERLAWGRFYGFPEALLIGDQTVADTPEAVWTEFQHNFPQVVRQRNELKQLEKGRLGDINHDIEEARLELRGVELKFGKKSAQYQEAEKRFQETEARLTQEYDDVSRRIAELRDDMARYTLKMKTADGTETTLGLADIVRAYPANRLTLSEKFQIYFQRIWEFLSDEPREANSEGGVFPAIFGTVMMTLLMSLAVVPLGVLAALYLREYAKSGVVVSAVRIAINNLAGVPSIVFGVFGLGFFCYIVGGGIDRWFFEARLPNPTFGTGGILWASLTLALLTLPVVIVATEEALASVPNSMREGSYACGAGKWQTLRRVVLPQAMPGILTGTILAMARGAGEVAPLMLVGAVKLAPELPFDHRFPFFHLERSFMHLGFHIYDLGFQSQNSEAAKPIVYATTLLLILVILTLNLSAVYLRNRLRKRFVVGHF